ncbi:pyrokinin-1 receptor isoform X1 [Ceratitis capitata]|uniref:pyrokinin-1 receptor isoform X1 n=1 Tax=Ceratitis capitata TaxID=7213 RepID=UPI0006188FD4|nr:pyrokinin-1 receptor isoform X1 [Ceratitis capitata]
MAPTQASTVSNTFGLLTSTAEHSIGLNVSSALYAIHNSSVKAFNNSTATFNYTFEAEHNVTLQHYYDLGPTRDPLKIVIPMTIIYSLIFVSGVIGNISTCIVIKKNRSMHTATNYYLFSLAISDFLLLLSGVPQEMYFIWSKYPYVFGEYFCIGRGVLAETSANATVLTITAFTVERYMAICHPFLGQAMSKLSRAIRIIVLIWLVSVLTAIPQAAQFGIIVWNGIEKCTVVRNIIQHSFQLSTFIFFFAPMSIILVLYLLIGLRLHRSNLMGAAGDTGGGVVGGRRVFSSISTGVSATNGRGSTGGGGVGGAGNGSGRLAYGNSSVVRACGTRKGSGRTSMKGTQSDTMLNRYVGGSQLSAVRGRMNHYGTRRVIKMLVAVVICFFLCWAPFHAQRLIAVYGINVFSGDGVGVVTGTSADGSSDGGGVGDDATANDKNHVVIYTVMTYVSGVLYYLSTCINPLLYNLMSNKFRQAFKSILLRKKTNGSLTYRRTQQSRNFRRNPTLTSSTQRESSDSDPHSKHSMLQAVSVERTQSQQPHFAIG